jgi:hypothetical protein
MELEGSLPCSQEPATGPYPETDKSRPQSPTLYLYIPILSSHLHLGLPSSLFSLYEFLASPTLCTRPAHVIVLDFITLIIFGEQYKL